MIGRLAPAAKVELLMPGLVWRVSVMVAPRVASISCAVVTVIGTKASSVTISAPGREESMVRSGVSSCADWESGVLDCVRGADLRFTTGLGAVTTMPGSGVWACRAVAMPRTPVAAAAAVTTSRVTSLICPCPRYVTI
jgi:hypothetical protein